MCGSTMQQGIFVRLQEIFQVVRGAGEIIGNSGQNPTPLAHYGYDYGILQDAPDCRAACDLLQFGHRL